MLQNSDESNNVVLIETSESEFDDEEDKDSWKAMQENEYKFHNLIKSDFSQAFYSQPSSSFGVKIFPYCWGSKMTSRCQFKHIYSSIVGLIEIAVNILKSHIEHYRSGPEETHD